MKSTPGQNRDVTQTREAGSFAAWRQESESCKQQSVLLFNENMHYEAAVDSRIMAALCMIGFAELRCSVLQNLFLECMYACVSSECV